MQSPDLSIFWEFTSISTINRGNEFSTYLVVILALLAIVNHPAALITERYPRRSNSSSRSRTSSIVTFSRVEHATNE